MAPDILLCRGGDVLRRRWCGQDSTDNVRCRPEDQPPSIWLDDPHRRDGYVHSVVVGSHPLIMLRSYHILPAIHGIHDNRHTVWICLWHEGLLRRQCRDTHRIRGRIFRPPLALQRQAA